MDRPVCRLCGVKHFAREPHVFSGSTVEPEKPIPCRECKANRITIVELKARIRDLEALNADPVSIPPASKQSVSRKEYMRNLMREKRAKAKAARQ